MKKIGTFTKFGKELHAFFNEKKGTCFLVTNEGINVDVSALKHDNEKYTFTIKNLTDNEILNQKITIRLHLLTDLAKEVHELTELHYEQNAGYGHAGGVR